ncbi:MAG: phosphoserine phosphatase SerB [Deltaproteobacteria bacterium]|nr:phosphoserine phosphatase SerB [Deltaproteobacteria bacterium]
MADENLLMVNIYGPDRPGIIAAFVKVLQNYEIELVDIQQASLQQTIGLHLLLKFDTASQTKDSAIKDLLFEGNQFNLALNFQLLAPDQIQRIDHRRRLVLTYFGDTPAIAELSKVLAEENANIEMISSATHHDARSFEMMVNTTGIDSIDRLKSRMMAKSRELNVDLAIQTMVAHRKNKRMICFDMDSTLVDMEGIDEMARKAGVHREVTRITDKAMRGDFDFEESLRQRVAMLRGLSLDDVVEIKNQMIVSQGAEALLTTLKWLGFKLGIVSGGFDIFADYLKDKFSLDFAFANCLEIKNGALTGKLDGDIVDAAQKARIVNQIACDMGIPLDQVVAIGDGANDSLMLSQAGLGIAYNAKKALDRVANVALSKAHFNHVFHLLGITEEDIEEAMSCKAL